MFILTAEPKELTIVLILGPIRMDQLSQLKGIAGLGAGWERMIRDTSRHGAEQTLIFVRPEGTRMGMFIVDNDGREMDVVQVSVDPDHLNESIGQYEHAHGDGEKAAGI
jgi:hypothetical protein